MQLFHVAHGYLVTRNEGTSYLMGRVCEHTTYTYEEGDMFFPWLGGIMVPEDLQKAIIAGEVKGRLVPYYMLPELYKVNEEDLRAFSEKTHRWVIEDSEQEPHHDS
jgi:hypothetical protein